MSAPQSQRWRLRPTLDLDTNKFSITGDELDSAIQLLNIGFIIIGRGMARCVRAIYSARLAYIYTDFQVSERLHEGPEFSGNYLIDYTIGFIIHYTIITS